MTRCIDSPVLPVVQTKREREGANRHTGERDGELLRLFLPTNLFLFTSLRLQRNKTLEREGGGHTAFVLI